LKEQDSGKQTVPRGPTPDELASELGAAKDVWKKVIVSVVERIGPVDEEWKSSKAEFGWICLLKQKKRTLVYLTPEKKKVLVALVLGERAVTIALNSSLPEEIKTLIKEARSYAEGRGIRFTIKSMDDASLVADLVVIKTTPK
jgi:hypothetical protein